MTTDTASAARAALSGTLFYYVGAAGAQRIPAAPVEVAPTLVRDRAAGDRIALSGVGRWLSDTANRAQDESAAAGEGWDRQNLEARVRSRFLDEGGADVADLAGYGPGGPDDRRRRSPYAGSADAALLDFASARAARDARQGQAMGKAAEGVAGPATIVDGIPPGGWTLRRGPDVAAISGMALRLLGLYGDAAEAAKAA